ncbi:DUF3826 domain-containing protein [Pedobacter immunditicola]|uniref:DUF3826 domain-containing protein n=1 Tax=Pedobacter immunditicola TaxID=3133440 RepID=UPI0030A1615B
MKNLLIALFLIFTATAVSFAQENKISADEKAAYLKVISLRADKIVVPLGIEDPAKAKKVSGIIRDQYNNLNDIHTVRDQQIKEIKTRYADDKAAADHALAKVKKNAETALSKLHKKYIKQLSSNLTTAQIEMVKNGMTYNVVPITYKAYQQQILTLTDAQKSQILTWLVEAREHAMDAESSDKKHAWFGKYKGKINNYLSAAGYDLKKEGIAWQKRIKAQAQIK